MIRIIFASAFSLLSLVGICAAIARQGKPRKPSTPTEVISIMIINGLWTAGIWWLAVS